MIAASLAMVSGNRPCADNEHSKWTRETLRYFLGGKGGADCFFGPQGNERVDEAGSREAHRPTQRRWALAFASSSLLIGFAMFGIAPLIGRADDLPDDVRVSAKEQRDTAIAQAKRQVTELEKQRVAASKRRDMSEVAALVQQIKRAKLDVSAATKKTVDDYAQEMLEARAKAAASAANMSKDGPPLVQPDDPTDEAERLELSGGCPLKITGGNFFHAHAEAVRLGTSAGMFPKDLFGPQTIVVCEVVNKADQPVQAYEVLCQFLDGFDEVITEKTFQGPLLAPGELRKSINGVTPIETAVQMKIYVQRTKLADGTIWKRQPEHKRVGVLVKRLEGAVLGAGK